MRDHAARTRTGHQGHGSSSVGTTRLKVAQWRSFTKAQLVKFRPSAARAALRFIHYLGFRLVFPLSADFTTNTDADQNYAFERASMGDGRYPARMTLTVQSLPMPVFADLIRHRATHRAAMYDITLVLFGSMLLAASAWVAVRIRSASFR